jgi:transposase
MLSFPSSVRIHLCVEPVDMRMSFNGLSAVVRNRLKSDPSSGSLYVFTNRQRNRLKILFWDGSGLWVLSKRLEQGRFSWPKGLQNSEGKLQLRSEALAMLLGGIDLKDGVKKVWYER